MVRKKVMALNAATSIWIVQYTSLGDLVRTSVFFEQSHALGWYEFCVKADADPVLWTSAVTFTQVTP
jgi:hypothetical protein